MRLQPRHLSTGWMLAIWRLARPFSSAVSRLKNEASLLRKFAICCFFPFILLYELLFSEPDGAFFVVN